MLDFKVPLNGIRNFQCFLVVLMLNLKLNEIPICKADSGKSPRSLPGRLLSLLPTATSTISSFPDHIRETTESPLQLSSLKSHLALVWHGRQRLMSSIPGRCPVLGRFGAFPSHLKTGSPFDSTGRQGRKYTFLSASFPDFSSTNLFSNFFLICM